MCSCKGQGFRPDPSDDRRCTGKKHHYVFIALWPIYTKRQRLFCNDVNDSALFDNNRVTSEWDSNPFSSDSVVINENKITSFITELLQR